ncbi:hypothetical protein NDI45_00095 [Leptolyngbya sp. GB1-A1]|uniref:hypothetical protein n=1 Tax=Leptolyngbya sp. GB1-A1 TaxID=2933908 RepID=UPI003297EC2E
MPIPHCFRQAAYPYRASTVSGLENNLPTADNLEVARFQGKQVTQVARALKMAGEMDLI